jgi:hypothetical protein
MKLTFSPRNKVASYLVMTVLVLVPFHGFLTVWGSALVGHYILLRLWDDALLAILVAVVTVWLIRDKELRQWFSGSLLVRLIAAYAGLTVLLGIVAYTKGDVTPKALAYGLLVNLRFLAWFLAVLLTVQRSALPERYWVRLTLVPAALVVVFACLQYTVLPHNFLGHFGYNAATNIAPIETINHDSRYIRVQSTLRGANPLGAYLVVVISALATLYVRGRRRIVGAMAGLVSVFALYASGSRSAWIGLALSLAVIGWLLIRTRRDRLLFGAVAATVVIVAAGSFWVLKHNAALQNAVLHTQDNSAVTTSSNEAHVSAVKTGLTDVAHQPLGDGPGTAGPASAYNAPHPVRIAEDYYVQVAQETGWLGLALFLSILALVATELYQRASGSPLALAVFVALIGVMFINLLSHAWTDDTLAFLWWGLAAVALGTRRKKTASHHV